MPWYAWTGVGIAVWILFIAITRVLDSFEGLLCQIRDELVDLNFKNEERSRELHRKVETIQMQIADSNR